MSIDQNTGDDTLNDFLLDMPEERMRRLGIGWLLLALGSLVVGGLLTSTPLTLFLMPVVYVMIDDLVNWLKRIFSRAHNMQAAVTATAE